MAQASEFCTMFLQEQAAVAALASDGDKEVIPKRLIQAQEWSNMYQILHYVFKPTHTGAITHLEVPADDDWQWPYDPKAVRAWKSELDSQKVEDHLFNRNILHFGQSKETPWTQAPFSDIPFSGTGPIADSILNGTYHPKLTGPTEKYVELLLVQLQRKLPEISTDITPVALTKGFKAWKEITSTSPSNRHLGHYLSLLSPDGRKDSNTSKELAASIMQVHHQMTAVCIKQGVSFNRWQQIVTTMLEKDTGHPKLHRLRVLHLLEADFNLLIKIIIARRFVWHCEDSNKFGEAQAGSRPGRSAIDVVLQKELTYDLSARTLYNLGMMENDATACFDRMIPSLVMISLRAYGVPENLVELIGKTLEKMRYRIKTKIGVSKRYYQHTENEPIYGTGQGSTGSPCFRALISIILFNIMAEIAHGISFKDPQGLEEIHRTMEAFVDDTDVAVNDAAKKYTTRKLAQVLQTDAQHWEKLLFTSGGKLELSKCFFYIMYWTFSEDGIPRLTPKSDIPHKLMLHQGNDNEPTKIEQKYCHQPHKTLGIMKAPDRSQTGERKRLKQKCDAHATAILSNSVTTSDAALAYRVYHLTSVGYSLGTTHITRKEFETIQSRAVSAFLAACGYNRHYPRALTFAPKAHGGLDFVHLYLLQGTQSIKLLLRYILHKTTIGKQISIDLAWIQQEAGTAQDIRTETQTALTYLQDGWVVGIRRFLQAVGGHITFTDRQSPQLYREGDAYLMDLFRAQGATAAELCRLNRSRLYLQLARTSDITNIIGNKVHDYALQLERDERTSQKYPTSKLAWPRQPRPGSTARKLWAKHVKRALLQADGRLRQELGKWLIIVDQRNRQ